MRYSLLIVRAALLLLALGAGDWPMFRGPNATRLSGDKDPPVEFGPSKNVVWKTALPPGHSSPSVAGNRIFLTAHENEKLFVLALLARSYRLNAYDVRTGVVVWWVGGLTWQLKPTPVIDNENVSVVGWAGEADPGQQEIVPTFEDTCARLDTNRDGKLSKEEIGHPKIVKQWHEPDLDLDGLLGPRDWSFCQSKRTVVNSVQAIRLGGRGDMTASAPLWKYYRSLPNVPSPLPYDGVLYWMKEGGILTTLDASTGVVLKQARLTGAPGPCFSSPAGADGKVCFISEEGADGNTARCIVSPGSQ